MAEEERNPTDPWLTLAEIAEELRVNPATVRQWVSKGQLKASRGGVRKWIVRRSDLDRMLAETNSSADDVLARAERGEPLQLGTQKAPAPRRPDPGPEKPSPAPMPRPPLSPKDEGAVELLRQALNGFEDALDDSAYAPPSPGYVDRIRAVAESCEHVAVNLLNAAQAAGIHWRSASDMAEQLPYELRAGGNRPGPPVLWEEFDAAFDRLAITATGTDITAVAYAFREAWETLRTVASELEAGGRSDVDPGIGRAVSDGQDGA